MAIQTFKSSSKAGAPKEMANAIASLEQVADPIYVLAIRFYESQNYPKALRLMEYLLRSQDPQLRYLRTTAIMLQADQQLEKALEFYARAAAMSEEGDPRISLGQAQCLIMLKQYAQAMPYLEQTWELLKDPTLPATLRNTLFKTCSPLMERVQELTQGE
jgi:tetratricopeptide (TPR) repeat protein